MKKRYSEEQVIGFVKEAGAGVSAKALATENDRVKKLLAESMLEREVTREALRNKWSSHRDAER